MGQGPKSLHKTHLFLVVNNCTKYEKDLSNGRKVMAQTQFGLQMDRQTDKLKPVYPSQLRWQGGIMRHAIKIIWCWHVHWERHGNTKVITTESDWGSRWSSVFEGYQIGKPKHFLRGSNIPDDNFLLGSEAPCLISIKLKQITLPKRQH